MSDSPTDIHGFSPTELRGEDVARIQLAANDRATVGLLRRLLDGRDAEVGALTARLAAAERENANLSLKLRGVPVPPERSPKRRKDK